MKLTSYDGWGGLVKSHDGAGFMIKRRLPSGMQLVVGDPAKRTLRSGYLFHKPKKALICRFWNLAGSPLSR